MVFTDNQQFFLLVRCAKHYGNEAVFWQLKMLINLIVRDR
jgi:hypothetical protein